MASPSPGDGPTQDEITWGVAAQPESHWPMSFAFIGFALLAGFLPEEISLGPWFLVPVLVAGVVGLFTLVLPRTQLWELRLVHRLAWAIIALVFVTDVGALIALADSLLGGSSLSGQRLLLAALTIWAQTVLVFGVIWWQLDRGGAAARTTADHPAPDLLFTQMATPGCGPPSWSPRFFDYLYVSFTASTAFSPTDTMPLTRRAKLIMLIESAVSFTIVVLLVAHAIGVLR
jgi:uncharacterized membrane protein